MANNASQDGTMDQLKKVLRYVRRMGRYPGTILGVTILVLSVFVARYFIKDKIFESSTVILIQDQKLPEEFIKSTVSHDPSKFISTLSKQVMSRSRLEMIIRDHDLYADMRKRVTLDEVVAYMQSHIEVKVYGKESFRITYTVNDPKTAQAVCARLAQMFIDENVNERSNQARTNAEFLARQAEDARQKLDVIEEEVRVFKESHLGSLPVESDSNSQSLDQIISRLNTISEDIRSARLRRSIEQGKLTETIFENDPSEQLRRELNAKRRELSQQLLQLEENHPTVLSLRSEVSQLEQSLRSGPKAAEGMTRINPQVAANIKMIDGEIGGLQGEMGQLKQQMANIQARQDKAPKVEMELSALDRKRKILEENYTGLLRKKEEAERAQTLEEQNQGAQFKVLDAANLPTRASGSGLIKLAAMGGVLGLVMGLGLALLRVLLDTRIYETADLTSYIDAEVLVAIPRFDERLMPQVKVAGLPSPEGEGG